MFHLPEKDDQEVDLFHLIPKGIHFLLVDGIILHIGVPCHLKGSISLQLEGRFLPVIHIPHGATGHLQGADHRDEDHHHPSDENLLMDEDLHCCAVGLLPHAIGPQFKTAGDHLPPRTIGDRLPRHAIGDHLPHHANGDHLLHDACLLSGVGLYLLQEIRPCLLGDHLETGFNSKRGLFIHLEIMVEILKCLCGQERGVDTEEIVPVLN